MRSLLTEIRWHGRGGQGAKTAALMLAEAASEAGLHVQGFPEYGPERMGAPVLAYNRISDRPISLHCHVTRPAVVAVLDPTLIKDRGVTKGLRQQGVLVVNTPAPPGEIRRKLALPDDCGFRVATVDASGISMETLDHAIPNTPMMGAVVRVSGLLEFGGFLEVVGRLLDQKFRARKNLARGNLEAIKRAYDEVKEG